MGLRQAHVMGHQAHRSCRQVSLMTGRKFRTCRSLVTLINTLSEPGVHGMAFTVPPGSNSGPGKALRSDPSSPSSVLLCSMQVCFAPACGCCTTLTLPHKLLTIPCFAPQLTTIHVAHAQTPTPRGVGQAMGWLRRCNEQQVPPLSLD